MARPQVNVDHIHEGLEDYEDFDYIRWDDDWDFADPDDLYDTLDLAYKTIVARRSMTYKLGEKMRGLNG